MDHTRRRVLTAAAAALALPWAKPARADAIGKADWIHVIKSLRSLQLFRDGHVLKTYAIALGAHPDGPKTRRGDGRTPEGVYRIDGRLADSAYHRALHVSYPDPADVARARAAGVDPGGAIFIHGLPAKFGRMNFTSFPRDWTNGCIAVGNLAIEEIWDAVDDGTPVEIHA
jgi:murein L,D-transpeptidase YafK